MSFFCVVFYSLVVECKVTIHTLKILVICPAEASHAPILNRSTAIIALVYAAPDVILSLVGKILSAVVARLIATIACAHIVALLLAPIADIRQNDRVDVALGTPAISCGWGVARVVALREALMTIVGPEYGGSCVATVGASH